MRGARRGPDCRSARPLGQCCRYCRQHCAGLALQDTGPPLRCLRETARRSVPQNAVSFQQSPVRVKRVPSDWVPRTDAAARGAVLLRSLARARGRAPRRRAARSRAARSASPVQCCRQFRQHWPSGRAERQSGPRRVRARSPALLQSAHKSRDASAHGVPRCYESARGISAAIGCERLLRPLLLSWAKDESAERARVKREIRDHADAEQQNENCHAERVGAGELAFPVD